MAWAGDVFGVGFDGRMATSGGNDRIGFEGISAWGMAVVLWDVLGCGGNLSPEFR